MRRLSRLPRRIPGGSRFQVFRGARDLVRVQSVRALVLLFLVLVLPVLLVLLFLHALFFLCSRHCTWRRVVVVDIGWFVMGGGGVCKLRGYLFDFGECGLIFLLAFVIIVVIGGICVCWGLFGAERAGVPFSFRSCGVVVWGEGGFRRARFVIFVLSVSRYRYSICILCVFPLRCPRGLFVCRFVCWAFRYPGSVSLCSDTLLCVCVWRWGLLA